jgi:uncharacterized protein (DUF58 family)
MPEKYREYLNAGEEIGSLFSMTVPSGVYDGLGGNRFSNRTGSSLEFMEHRDYVPGDDLRRLDWGAYARTDKLMVKQYREEVCPRLELLLDTSASMALSDSEKARSILFTAAALISAAVNSGFTVRAYLCRETLEPVPGEATRPAGWEMIDFAGAWNPGIALENFGGNFQPRSIRVLISDLIWMYDPEVFLSRFARDSTLTAVVRVLGGSDINPPTGSVRLIDSETGETGEYFIDREAAESYTRELEHHMQHWHRACREFHAPLIELKASETMDISSLLPLAEAQLLQRI